MDTPAPGLSVASAVSGGHRDTIEDEATATRVNTAALRKVFPSGSTVGRYVLLRPLGHGGAGVVYEAFDPELGRGVAIKVLHPEPGGDGSTTNTLQGRLLLEAKAMAKVRHPNVMPVYDAGTFDGQVFVAMELMEGGTLRRWLATGARSRKEILRVFLAAGRGLAAAHAAGLVHRDFKPDNVMIGTGTTGEERVLVTDFGLVQAAFRETSSNATPIGETQALAKLRSTQPPPVVPTDPLSSPSLGDLSAPRLPTFDGPVLTETGTLLGTPGFMAPEQILLGPVSPASDQFAFSVSLLEALSGGRTFPGKTLMDRLNATVEGKPSRGPNEVPKRIAHALERGLSVEPEKRWPSMDDLLAELARDPLAKARPWFVFGALSLGVVAVAMGAARASSSRVERCNGARAHLSGVWDDGVRARVESAFTALPFASQSLRTVESKLDGYSNDWASMQTEACLAGVRGEQVPEVQTLRMECLEQRLTSLRATTSVLASADRGVITKAIDLTTALPRIEACADVEALRAPVPLPTDVGVRAKIQSLRGRLEAVRADLLAGKVAPSVPKAQALAEEARAVAYSPLVADALLTSGLAEQMSGAFKDAEPTLEESARVADIARSDHTRAEALVKLTFVVGYGLARRPEGLRWGSFADAAVERVRDRALEGDCAYSLAVTYLEAGDRAKTLEQALRAVSIDEEVLGADNLATVKAVNVLGAAYDQARDSAAAERTYQRALATYERLLGPNHPYIAAPLGNLGLLYSRLGRYEEAVTLMRRSNAIERDAYGPDHVDIALGSAEIAAALRGMKKLDEAIAEADASIVIYEKDFGPEHVDLYLPLMEKGRALLAAGKAADALAPLERSVALGKPGEVDPVLLAEAKLALGQALTETGKDRARGRKLADAALEQFTSTDTPEPERAEAVRAWEKESAK